MDVFNWSDKDKAMISSSGMLLVTDPRTGEHWRNQKQAEQWWQLEQVANTPGAETPPVGRINIDSIAVKEQTGTLIADQEKNGQPAEVTVSRGAVLNINASILPLQGASDIVEQLDDQLFRIPLKNQKTAEVLLFAGLVQQGRIELEVTLEEAGFWQVDQQLVNEKLPAELKLQMQPLTISVVNTNKGLLAKFAALIGKAS